MKAVNLIAIIALVLAVCLISGYISCTDEGSSTLMPTPTKPQSTYPKKTLTPTPTPDCVDGVCTYYDTQPPYGTRMLGTLIQLVNNKDAIDPTWERLKTFLVADKTDEEDYVLGIHICGNFAETVHNNAEAAGIRAAWISVDFKGESDGHALNAFNTVDRGLVYVDCTGETSFGKYKVIPQIGSSESRPKVYGEAESWDKIAYISTGEEYGVIGLEVASCPEYECYEEYKQRKLSFEYMLDEYNQQIEAYNLEVARWNSWIEGKVFIIGTSDHQRAKEWEALLHIESERLNTVSDTLHTEGYGLGAFWEPSGIVSRVEIYW